MRVIVTGSRDWNDRAKIVATLDALLDEAVDRGEKEFTVVHGAASGADAIAGRWGRETPEPDIAVTEEPHPADWGRFGKRAGFERNAEMADLGADLCLAFIRPCTKADCMVKESHDSHGTASMVTLCAQHAIAVTKVRVHRGERAS